MSRVIIGAGGHAAVVYEIAQERGIIFDAFIDEAIHSFKNLEKKDEFGDFSLYIIGFGGVNTKDLVRRQVLYDNYKRKKYKPFSVIARDSFLSESAKIEVGVLIGKGVVIQPGAKMGENSIVNTGAIIEHDAIIGEGCHIAPGAIILGGANIGACSMIGAGAVVLPNQIIPPQTLVKALSRYYNES